MRRRIKPPPHRPQDRWLVPYADFVTLLFAFFATMYAISSLDAGQAGESLQALERAFERPAPPVDVPGPAPVEVAPAPEQAAAEPVEEPAVEEPVVEEPAVNPPMPLDEDVGLDRLHQQLLDRLAHHVRTGRVELHLDRRGLVISIPEAGSFATGRAEPAAALTALVAEIAAPMLEVANFVRVEGHTDDVPIRTRQYASNWELSTARATSVVAHLIGQVGLDPARLSAAGYAEFHPRVPNDSPANRARNRRVDIVLLNARTVRAEEPGALAHD